MPPKIITRNLINKDIELIIGGTDTTYNYDQIINYIDRIKTFLIKEKNAKPGQTIMLLQSDIHVPWLYACAELGMQLVIAMHPTFKNTKKEEQARELYGTVDFVVLETSSDIFNIRYFYENPIQFDIVEDYTDTSCSDIYYATENCILTRSVSESAEKIKVEYHTHEFFANLLERNAALLNLKYTDRCLHNKMLHHGPVFGEFFLPSIKYAKTHIWYTVDDHDTYEYVFKYKINRATFFYQRIQGFEAYIFYNSKNFTQDHLDTLKNLTVHLIRSPANRTIKFLTGQYNVSFDVSFGSTATIGPVLLQQIDKTNYLSYNKFEFFDPQDGFYKPSVVNGALVITLTDGTTVTTSDSFEYQDGKYYFKG